MKDKGRFIDSTPDGKEIRVHSQDQVERFKYELEEILDLIGHPEALITDRSSVADFFIDADEQNISEVLERIADHFAIEIPQPDESLVDIAKRARKARKGC